ncbi:MAG TPA: hypothetical protein VEX38_10700, partial [Fimbriimonadaceae bacterium]|nr:hypothetical protein [Fimbriimonadaceae bacterium]
TEEGLRIRLISALAASDGDLGLAQKMRDALLADVDSWTEAELQRAVGFARASFAMQGWATPMYLGHDAPISTSEADSTFLRAWWHMKSGKAWDQQAVLASMEAVKLEELKEASLEMLKEATPRVITGRKPD